MKPGKRTTLVVSAFAVLVIVPALVLVRDFLVEEWYLLSLAETELSDDVLEVGRSAACGHVEGGLAGAVPGFKVGAGRDSSPVRIASATFPTAASRSPRTPFWIRKSTTPRLTESR